MKIIKVFRKKLEVSNWLIILLSVISGIKALRNVAISVPQAVKIFDTATLQCKYNLEGEPLYAIKWYKGSKEFFRYIPKEFPSTLAFPVTGMDVDVKKSGQNQVVLREVQIELTGRYHCEVSTDAPNFDTQSDSNFMYVVDVPNDNSIMEIGKENLGYGYKLKANCTTPPSFPAMNITWYINGIKVNELVSKKISMDPTSEPSKRKRTPYMTISYMEKEIDDNIYQSEVVKVQCISTLFNLYRSENLRYIDDNRPQPWPSSVIGITENISGAIIIVPVWIELLILLGVYIFR